MEQAGALRCRGRMNCNVGAVSPPGSAPCGGVPVGFARWSVLIGYRSCKAAKFASRCRRTGTTSESCPRSGPSPNFGLVIAIATAAAKPIACCRGATCRAARICDHRYSYAPASRRTDGDLRGECPVLVCSAGTTQCGTWDTASAVLSWCSYGISARRRRQCACRDPREQRSPTSEMQLLYIVQLGISRAAPRERAPRRHSTVSAALRRRSRDDAPTRSVYTPGTVDHPPGAAGAPHTARSS